MRLAIALAIVLLALKPAVAQEGDDVLKAGRFLRITFMYARTPPFASAYLHLEDNGSVELEKVSKGLGRACRPDGPKQPFRTP
jgi:hypothetical protein